MPLAGRKRPIDNAYVPKEAYVGGM